MAVRYLVAAPGTGHLVHAEASRDFQEALIGSHPIKDGSSYFPCYLEQHAEYNQGQNIHSIHVVASCHQGQYQVLHLSENQIHQALVRETTITTAREVGRRCGESGNIIQKIININLQEVGQKLLISHQN